MNLIYLHLKQQDSERLFMTTEFVEGETVCIVHISRYSESKIKNTSLFRYFYNLIHEHLDFVLTDYIRFWALFPDKKFMNDPEFEYSNRLVITMDYENKDQAYIEQILEMVEGYVEYYNTKIEK